MSSPLTTRFAPSPTGDLHIGGARTALFSWLAAKSSGGKFMLRVEDTDTTRNKESSVEGILNGLQWLGLTWAEPVVFQTTRLNRYMEVATKLLESGHAYYAYESEAEIDLMRESAKKAGHKPRYNRAARDLNLPFKEHPDRVLRFKTPLWGTVCFDDSVKGPITWSNEELDDFVLMRSNNTPTYNFAVVVDDLDMQISDVIRGDDHVNNTPRQIHLYQALGAPIPNFAHLPMILNPEGKKLSKRDGAASILQYRQMGYYPEVLLNYLARLGWSHGDQEIFTRSELIALFDLKAVNAAPSKLDFKKLDWFNQKYLQSRPASELVFEFEYHLKKAGLDSASGPDSALVIKVLADRSKTLIEMVKKARFWYETPNYDAAVLKTHLGPTTSQKILNASLVAIEGLKVWTEDSVEEALKEVGDSLEIKLGVIAQTLRMALTGGPISPGIVQTIFLLGQAETQRRIEKVQSLIHQAPIL